jgi:hypothetical protein
MDQNSNLFVHHNQIENKSIRESKVGSIRDSKVGSIKSGIERRSIQGELLE